MIKHIRAIVWMSFCIDSAPLTLSGVRNANEKVECKVGRRSQGRQRHVQGREWRDQRAVQLQLALRGRSGIESRRIARGRGSGMLQHGVGGESREKRNAANFDRNNSSVYRGAA